MWTRKELKTKAKEILKLDYWKIVLVSLILFAISSGLGSNSGYRTGYNDYNHEETVIQENNEVISMENYEENGTLQKIQSEIRNDEDTQEIIETVSEIKENSHSPIYMLGFAIGLMVGIFIIFIIAFAISVFLINPIIVGAQKFFINEVTKTSPKIKDVVFFFDNYYRNVAITMFIKDLYIFFWTLLFIIPGIIKSYEYRMIPYILSEHPEMSREEVFAKSKEMMNGQKWDAFVLDLSFFGWYVLSGITLGILSIFYVLPYNYLTNAVLYCKLSKKDYDTTISEIVDKEEVSSIE